MRQQLRDYLASDATFASLMTGGVYAVREVKRTGDTADAFDANGEIKPCVNIRVDGDMPAGPFDYSARTLFSLYFYQFNGFDVIDQAADRAYALLHRCQNIPGIRMWEVKHNEDLPDIQDDSLLCSLRIVRYQVTRNREPV